MRRLCSGSVCCAGTHCHSVNAGADRRHDACAVQVITGALKSRFPPLLSLVQIFASTK